MKKINEVELKELFNSIRNNDKLAFENLYKKCNKLVYSIAFSILKNKENSEDIVQIVFLKIYTLDKNKLPTNKELSWLYTLTKNETLNFLRSKKEEINIEDIYYITTENTELEDIMDKDKYNRLISSLTVEEQEIISLKILSNLSFKEISQLLKIPMGTVQWKYYKALHTLKILISNFTMFIVAIAVFVVNKVSIQRKNQDAEDIDEKAQEDEKTQGSKDSEIIKRRKCSIC